LKRAKSGLNTSSRGCDPSSRYCLFQYWQITSWVRQPARARPFSK